MSSWREEMQFAVGLGTSLSMVLVACSVALFLPMWLFSRPGSTDAVSDSDRRAIALERIADALERDKADHTFLLQGSDKWEIIAGTNYYQNNPVELDTKNIIE